MIIELYLDSDKGAVKGEGTGNLPWSMRAGWTPTKDSSLNVKMAFVNFTDEENELRTRLDRIATEHNLEIILYDTARTRYAMRAFFKGVKILPTVIIGKHILTGKITEAQIIKVINEQSNV